ncbi:hypothetical protein PF003_g24729 [Phytophthora fragariae]|nr:hypothetical protein PF003_g24729 [Phytophthora fragariae]
MDHLAEAIHEDEDAGAAFSVMWKDEDEVHAGGPPRARGDGQRTKRSLLGHCRLHTLADLAGVDPFPYALVHARPEEVTRECCERLLAPEMTTGGCIVVLVHQTSTKVAIRGDEDTGVSNVSMVYVRRSPSRS